MSALFWRKKLKIQPVNVSYRLTLSSDVSQAKL